MRWSNSKAGAAVDEGDRAFSRAPIDRAAGAKRYSRRQVHAVTSGHALRK
jgi:hypothetical protein